MPLRGGNKGANGAIPPVTTVVNDAVNWVEVLRINAGHRPVLLRLTAGEAAIDALKVGQSVFDGEAAIDLAVGVDLNAGVDAIPYCIPAIGAAPAMAIAAVHEILLDSGAADYVISAKGTATTLRVQGRVL